MTSPHALALAYDRYVSTLWRGEDAKARAFAVWLAGYWVDEAPAEPADQPHVVSVLGGAGAGIRWYACGERVVGYIGGRSRGYYEVPVEAALPSPPAYAAHCEKRDTTGAALASGGASSPSPLAWLRGQRPDPRGRVPRPIGC